VRHFSSLYRIVDFVDIDSDKWRQYADSKSWPVNWIYQREAKLLFDYEKQIANEFDSACFVSEKEANCFKQLVPGAIKKITYFNNGVDTEFFSPQLAYENPYPNDVDVLVFTGAMDYWANVDAVDWFAHKIFPAIRSQLPKTHFFIVGNKPTDKVMALAAIQNVTVTGSVKDVRPYLSHASLVVAPLRIARGIQNKVLEAMSMEKIVVASPQAKEGINAIQGQELFVTEDESDYSNQIITLLQKEPTTAVGRAARCRILSDYCWEKSLIRVDQLLSNQTGIQLV
jgi:sugar transferase (PEP-CTERM/EpsH1 system associated)